MAAERPSNGPAAPVAPENAALHAATQQLVLALMRRQAEAVLLDGMAGSNDGSSGRDALTGLPGRTTLLERFDTATDTAQREGKRLAVLSVELDGLNQFTDDSSHRGGDAVLQHVARCLDASVRGSDTVSRHGGDAFVVLLTDLCLQADAGRVAENMLRSLMAPERIGEHAVSMSANVGISIFPDDGRTLEELMHQADGARFRAKRQGSVHYAFHGADEPARHLCLAPAIASGVLHPQAAALDPEQLRQGRMQEANEQLLLAALTAKELQSAAERALGDQTALMARVAHELRNPLTPIRMAASLIDRADIRELPRLRAVIERQVAQAARLVGDLLDLSRARVGKLRLQRSVVNIGGLVAEVIEATRTAMATRRQHLLVDMPVQALRVEGDRVRLTQVLSNLLDNASKYTPDEGTITVSVHGDGTDVVIGVSDTGIGISAAAIGDVFQPFVQESHATRFHGAGLGIGLTVVRELAEAHGGKVQAFSAGEGRGSQFVLTLPQYVGREGPDEVAIER